MPPKFTRRRELGVAKRDVVKTCVATSLPRNSVRGGKLDTNLCFTETVALKSIMTAIISSIFTLAVT